MVLIHGLTCKNAPLYRVHRLFAAVWTNQLFSQCLVDLSAAQAKKKVRSHKLSIQIELHFVLDLDLDDYSIFSFIGLSPYTKVRRRGKWKHMETVCLCHTHSGEFKPLHGLSYFAELSCFALSPPP